MSSGYHEQHRYYGSNVSRSKSSARWLREHFRDEYVKRAHAEGLRSRAVFKLEEILQRDRLLKAGMRVVDLGAAPGSWSQTVRAKLGDSGQVIALDILPMQGIHGVEFLQGDFRESEVLLRLEAAMKGERLDLVLSDMAPNLSGIEVADQARAMELADLALDFARSWLKPDGALLIKLFQGSGIDQFIRDLRRDFRRVSMRKPKASRARSREVYALVQGRKV